MNDNSACLTITELMARWKVARKTILEQIRAGKLHAFRVGERSYRVTLTEVLRYESNRAA